MLTKMDKNVVLKIRKQVFLNNLKNVPVCSPLQPKFDRNPRDGSRDNADMDHGLKTDKINFYFISPLLKHCQAELKSVSLLSMAPNN